jgi:hypothetical protein
MSFFSQLFLIAFSGASQRGEVKNTKKRFAKQSASKCFDKKIDKKSKIDFFLDFLSRFWGVFLGMRSSKTPLKKSYATHDKASIPRARPEHPQAART